MNKIVSVQGLVKSYGGAKAVNGISFEVAEGEIVAVLGPNGAGKTTTIEILEGFRRRTSGTIDVLGEDPERAGRAWRSQIGLVLQSTSLESTLTVVEALRYFRSMYANPRKLREVLIATELLDLAEERITTLSGGQQRRVDFAVGIIGNPKLLFLDEPTTGLDPEARQRAWQTVSTLASQGMTTILTTHYLDEAERLADRVIIIANGKILANAAPAEIESQDDPTIQFEVHKNTSLKALPFANKLKNTNEIVSMHSSAVTDDLRVLLDWSKKNNVGLRNLEVKRPSLEEVYLALTTSGVKGNSHD